MLPERLAAPSRWTALRGGKEVSSAMLWLVMLSRYHPSSSGSTESKKPTLQNPRHIRFALMPREARAQRETALIWGQGR
jgi:hypothetical protein